MAASPSNPRPHGTRNRYMLGAWGSDTANGCRCQPCRTANAIYQAKRRGGLLIDPAPTLAHVEFLRSRGLGTRTIADAAGVDMSTIRRLVMGAKVWIRPTTADAILSVHALHPAAQARQWVPADTTWRIVDGLVATGWKKKAIAAAIGQPGSGGLQLGRTLVTKANAAKVDELARQAAPDVWRRVHEQIAADKAASDRHADAVERRQQREHGRYLRRKAQRSEAA